VPERLRGLTRRVSSSSSLALFSAGRRHLLFTVINYREMHRFESCPPRLSFLSFLGRGWAGRARGRGQKRNRKREREERGWQGESRSLLGLPPSAPPSFFVSEVGREALCAQPGRPGRSIGLQVGRREGWNAGTVGLARRREEEEAGLQRWVGVCVRPALPSHRTRLGSSGGRESKIATGPPSSRRPHRRVRVDKLDKIRGWKRDGRAGGRRGARCCVKD
jgi:hypothetical protein